MKGWATANKGEKDMEKNNIGTSDIHPDLFYHTSGKNQKNACIITLLHITYQSYITMVPKYENVFPMM